VYRPVNAEFRTRAHIRHLATAAAGDTVALNRPDEPRVEVMPSTAAALSVVAIWHSRPTFDH